MSWQKAIKWQMDREMYGALKAVKVWFPRRRWVCQWYEKSTKLNSWIFISWETRTAHVQNVNNSSEVHLPTRVVLLIERCYGVCQWTVHSTLDSSISPRTHSLHVAVMDGRELGHVKARHRRSQSPPLKVWEWQMAFQWNLYSCVRTWRCFHFQQFYWPILDPKYIQPHL